MIVLQEMEKSILSKASRKKKMSPNPNNPPIHSIFLPAELVAPPLDVLPCPDPSFPLLVDKLPTSTVALPKPRIVVGYVDVTSSDTLLSSRAASVRYTRATEGAGTGTMQAPPSHVMVIVSRPPYSLPSEANE